MSLEKLLEKYTTFDLEENKTVWVPLAMNKHLL